MNKRLNHEYWKTLIPIFLGSIGMAIYYFTDGLFIGNALGDDGMSSITISWTIVTFLTAIATGVGFGGSIRFAVAKGEGDEEDAKKYFFSTIQLLLFISIILTVILVIWNKKILILLGAQGNVLTYSVEYCFLVSWGVVFQVFGIGALPLVRNTGGYKLASLSMGIGYMVNFVLDYVLMIVIPLGMVGCSIAYIAGQIVVAVPCFLYLLNEAKKRYNQLFELDAIKETLKAILITGIAPFGLYFSQNIVSVLINKGFINTGGSEALACYTVVIYIAGITNTLHRAVMDGSQPLMSHYQGKSKIKEANIMAINMYLFSAILIGIGAFVTLVFKTQIVASFGVSKQVEYNVGIYLPFYLVGYTAVCFGRTTISYLSSIDQAKLASILTYYEPIVMSITVLVIPQIVGPEGMWIAIIGTYLSVAIVSIIMILYNRVKQKDLHR